MKINISYCKPYVSGIGLYKEWFFMFKRYTAVNGFIIRIFGVYFNVRENNATEKLIKLFKESKR